MDRRKFLIATSWSALAMTAISRRAIAEKNGPLLKVGVLVPLSGPGAEFGGQERQAFEAVFEKINAAGGIGGHPVQVIVKDSKANPTEAARLANQLILDDGVVAITTGTGADTMAIADIVARARVPLFFMGSTFAATDPKAQYYPWVFRICTTATDDAVLIRDRVVKEGHKRLAIFFSEDAFGQQSTELAERITREKNDIGIVLKTSAALNATDLTAPALTVRRSDADAVMIFSGAGANAAGGFLRKLRELGSKIPAYGPAALAQPALVRAAGEAAEGMTLAAIFNADEPGQLQPLFDVLKDHGGARGFGSLLGAASAATIAEGLKAGGKDGPALRDVMEKLPPFSPYTAGKVQYTPQKHDGWGPQNLLIVRVKNGKFINLES